MTNELGSLNICKYMCKEIAMVDQCAKLLIFRTSNAAVHIVRLDVINVRPGSPKY